MAKRSLPWNRPIAIADEDALAILDVVARAEEEAGRGGVLVAEWIGRGRPLHADHQEITHGIQGEAAPIANLEVFVYTFCYDGLIHLHEKA